MTPAALLPLAYAALVAVAVVYLFACCCGYMWLTCYQNDEFYKRYKL